MQPRPEVLRLHDPVSPEWLTRCLRASGVLPRGVVVEIGHRTNQAWNSRVDHLTATYSDDTSPRPPRKLLLKRNGRGWGELEVAFYRLVGGHAAAPPMLVPCYSAAFDTQTGASHLLLADLGDTHCSPVERQQLLDGEGVPSAVDLTRVITALARFHAFFWEHPAITQDGPFAVRWWYRDEATFAQHVARRESEWAAFVGDAKHDIPPDLRELYEEALRELPALWTFLEPRVTTGRALTVSQGDCYLTQWLCPRSDKEGETFLIDFDSVSGNFGAYDLSYLMPTFWTPQQRRDHELECLRRYYETLLESGVTGFGWDELLSDYRTMINLMIFDPVFDANSGAQPAYWGPKMRCLTSAFRHTR